VRDGVVYAFDLPLKEAGAIQYRVAIRDHASGRLGTAGQFVEAPGLSSGRLALSGIILQGSAATPNPTDSESNSSPAGGGSEEQEL
jgi:hypothetical protein